MKNNRGSRVGIYIFVLVVYKTLATRSTFISANVELVVWGSLQASDCGWVEGRVRFGASLYERCLHGSCPWPLDPGAPSVFCHHLCRHLQVRQYTSEQLLPLLLCHLPTFTIISPATGSCHAHCCWLLLCPPLLASVMTPAVGAVISPSVGYCVALPAVRYFCGVCHWLLLWCMLLVTVAVM